LQFFLLFLPSTWSATACATRSIRARADRAASQRAFSRSQGQNGKAQNEQMFSDLLPKTNK
jgi:hypothetical protein